MAHSADDYQDGLMSAVKSLGWIVFAAAVAAAAAWGAYYKLGGIDTPVQKAGVVGAALVGLTAAVYLNKIARLVIFGLIIVVLIWGANYWYHHYS